MVRSNSGGSADIRAAIKKLKDKSNEKEVELIDLVASVYETLKDTRDEAVYRVKDSANTVNTHVHLHPWYYIGGAAACAFVVGLFIRR